MSNLSEEEKKAIDILENVIADEVICTYCTEFAVPKYNCNLCVDKNGKPDDCYYEKAIDIVLNLIEKQQVEINKEKEKNKKLQDDNIKYKNANDYLSSLNHRYYEDNVLLLRKNGHIDILKDNIHFKYIDDAKNYISKDKIREKIKEYKKYDNGINYENEISVLQELLEEGDNK